MAKPLGSKARLREYFLQNVGNVLTSRELQRVSGGSAEFARRIRELRNEEGYPILTHNDLASLKPGEYMLESLKLRPAFARTLSKETRALVLDRNGFTCQMCGIAAGELDDAGRRARLHIGHVVDKSMGGDDELGNLRALCTNCNEGASNITLERPTATKLLAQIRRAPNADQIVVLKWLAKKFPSESA